MSILESKFTRLGTNDAPGQEVRQDPAAFAGLVRGDRLAGTPVDFSHGDVDAHRPAPGAFEAFSAGVEAGGRQAYTEYRGDMNLREHVAARLALFTGMAIDAANEVIITPGTQGALFLALAATTARGDKVAIVQPDYFANRKIVEFLEAEMVPIPLHYTHSESGRAGLDLDQLESSFEQGVNVFLFSNPNNPTGVIYSADEIASIARLATRHGVTVIVDQLYSRLLYEGSSYSHLRAHSERPDNLVTIMGPSKTESLSGYRLGVALGSREIIERMEKLQAIVSLRAAGYSQAVLRTWFAEPEGWMDERIRQHQAIRDDLLQVLRGAPGVFARAPQAGSYLFPRLPPLAVSHSDFVKILRLQAGVTVTPGTEFSPHCSDSVRLNFSQMHEAAISAAKRLTVLLARYG